MDYIINQTAKEKTHKLKKDVRKLSQMQHNCIKKDMLRKGE